MEAIDKLLDGLRHVGNLHEFAELFGFDWYDDSDWTWHDVAVKMADDFEQAIAATLGSGTRDKTEEWLLNACNQAARDYVAQLEQERDELKSKLEAATLGSDASAVRLAERLRSIADEMRNVGASTMTPHELLAFYAHEVDKVADSLMFAATLGSEREKAENAKLRELVKEMRMWCLEDECRRCHELGDMCDLEHQMRELGIGVDE